MSSRRAFLKTSLLAGAVGLAGMPRWRVDALAALGAGGKAPRQFTRHVDVFIGTGGHGHTYPGATMPFGMVQLSPDTYNALWDQSSGYHQDDGSIMGFSHTHLTGTGCGDLLDFLVMPNVGEVKTEPGNPDHPITRYASRFDTPRPAGAEPDAVSPTGGPKGYRAAFTHADESAEPGYYRVLLRDRAVTAELTATARVGVHRYTFANAGDSHILVDLFHAMQDNPSTPPPVTSADLAVIGNDTLTGGRIVQSWAKGRHVYFALKFSRPFDRCDVFVDDAAGSAVKTVHGKKIKCAAHFKAKAGEQILVKVGLSAVSAEGALANLNAEMPGWDFDGTREAASMAWERELSRLKIDAINERHQRIFYTALYHSLIAPTLFGDVDGKYRGMDLEIHQLPAGAQTYTEYSLWDTYRALHPLFTLVQPHRVPDLCNDLIRMAAQSPAGPPVWPLYGRETGTMTGYHSAPVLAEAHAKGFKGINFEAAWPSFRKRAMDDDYRGLKFYRDLGFIPADKIDESVSKTLEYAYDDWAMAELAHAVGKEDERVALMKRSRNYRHVFDKSKTFVRPRLADGSWAEPFDPRGMGHSKKWRDFTESNAWQATFLNQHDLHAYIQDFGGDEAFVAKLDALFNGSPDLPADAPPDIAGMVGQYAHGNEPSHHVAWLYAYAGQPWKTQHRVRWLLDNMYDDKPDGEAGNDDCGQISAWYLLSSLGLYAVDPVSANYVLGSPLVHRAEVELADGKKLVVEAKGNSPENVYVQSVTWNGKPHDRNWISHAEIAAGGSLVFTLGPKPNKAFGVAQAARPPSMKLEG